ncbi:hypothetical protein [Bartonella tamiae]|uniref:Uncharacterized protein n=1 Tax=Bartonella tamiae Th239 TaxID=1094558 RepID=J0R7I2_9HYPH|nr:hypothetical protein [Bartonella tamiae]EJF91694.1 hypothetical protein ME5_00073 [Bartonella tamiae Th239]
MSEKIDISHAVAFAEATAESDFWRKRALINAALRDKAEQQIADMQKEIAKLKGNKNDNK